MEPGEVQTEQETLPTSDEVGEEFRRSLMQVVLKGQILEKSQTQENEQAYQSIVDLIIARVLPEASLEEPMELVEFYKVMSAFETQKMKYFLPLLRDLRRRIQSKIAMDDLEENELEMLRANVELIKNIQSSIEQRLEVISQDQELEGSSEGSLDESKNDPDEEDSRGIEKIVDQNVRAIVAMQEELSELKKMVQSLPGGSSSHSTADNAGEKISRLLDSMQKKQDKTLQLLLRLINEKNENAAREPVSEEGRVMTPATEGRYAPDEEEERYAEEDTMEDPSIQEPPHAFEYKIYGIDSAALKRLMRSGNPGAEGSDEFDPRVYRVLERNDRQWAKLLAEWSYKGVPTTLSTHLTKEGVQIHLGSDGDALKRSEDAYAKAVRSYLRNGGSECLLKAAKKASIQPFVAPSECK